MPKVVYKDTQGANQEFDLEVSAYRAAKEEFLTLPQWLSLHYPTNDKQYGSTFEQLMAGSNMFLHSDPSNGIRPPTLNHILRGDASFNAGTIVRDASPVSRILFPAVVLEQMESGLKDNNDSYVSMFESLIAVKDSVNGPRFEQPIINYSNGSQGPTSMRSQPISQLAHPAAMISITASDVARAIPTFSLGMEISDQALQASTLDLVTLALSRQAEIERAARVDEFIKAFHGGDLDMGQAALVAVTTTSLDSAASGGAVTQLSWMKFLRRNFKKRRIDWVMCDLATALAIENRTNKPTVEKDDPTSTRIDALATVRNPSWSGVNIFLLDDGVITAGQVLALDSRYAIRRVRNSQADYAATEEFVLKRGQAMRFDFGEVAYRLFDDAWDLLTVA
jgi:hypothetical protein